MISRTVVNRPTTVFIVFSLLAGLALYMVPQIPIDLYPEMNPPILVVVSNYEGAGPEEVEKTLTKPLESTLTNVSNLKKLTSTSSKGNTMIILEFEWGYDLTEAANEIRDKLEFIKELLPEESSTPQIFKFDPSMIPILDLTITGNRPPEELFGIAETQVLPYLDQVEGVAVSFINGGQEEDHQGGNTPEPPGGLRPQPHPGGPDAGQPEQEHGGGEPRRRPNQLPGSHHRRIPEP